MLPKHKIKDYKVIITTEEHSILIDVRNDKLYLDGEPLEEHHLSFDRKFEKKKTKEIAEKEKVKTIREHWGKNVLRIDKSKKDGRIFFLYFTKGAFDSYRGKPRWKASYFPDGYEKKFFVNNLHNPVKRWWF